LLRKFSYLLVPALLWATVLPAQKKGQKTNKNANTRTAKPKAKPAARPVTKTSRRTETAPSPEKEVYRTQSREQLESQRMAILEEIKRTQGELTELRQDKKATLAQLQALQSKLQARQSLINNINNEIRYIEANIHNATADVETLRTQLDTLKKQYAEMVRYTYKNRTSSDLVVFLFSAQSFNDAIRRLQYVKQYRNYRADQALKITSAHKQLTNKITVLNLQKEKKDYVLLAQENQRRMLEAETQEKDKVVLELKGKEKELMQGLALKKKAAEDLNRAIAAAIQREIELARKRAMQERMEQDRLRKLKEDQERRLALQKKREQEAAIERQRKEEYERKLALAKKEQEENERKLALAKKQQEENERRLAQEKKDREEAERRLAQEKKEREEAERKAAQLAEAKRADKERQLAAERRRQEEEQAALNMRRREQEEQQRQLLARKQQQEEEQRRLADEKKKQEREQARLSNPNYGNPRYIPELAEEKFGGVALATGSSERGGSRPTESGSRNTENRPAAANVKTFERDDYLFSLTPAEREIANNFEASKGSLPWPVEKGYIIEHFGKNKHPVFNIVTENYGIDIRTSRGARARAVFGGEVASVISIPGAPGQTVLINHGSYYTVYAKLDKVNVSKGMKVSIKQPIGTVLTDDDGNTQINFQVWKVGANGASFKVNPELYIAH
jgi:septal ring factor EnvC (AmiA/AmiB activator)